MSMQVWSRRLLIVGDCTELQLHTGMTRARRDSFKNEGVFGFPPAWR
jgi:hypothetical protein